jgi:ABC-type Mn2+/Zn2+ transport system permease subunit
LKSSYEFVNLTEMKDLAGRIVQSPIARALVVLVLIVPVSVYLGTSAVRRGILYYLEVFAPSAVLGVAVGLWTWSWKWFGYALLIGAAMTALTQCVLYLLLR